MKLSDCNLNIDRVVMRPPIINSPDPEWIEANENKIIPENIYRFYCQADYFSLDKAPKFLNDENRMLFSLLSYLLLGIRYSFEEALELVGTIKDSQGKGYSPAKRARGEDWDHKADKHQIRSLRNLIITLTSTLDQFAEIVAIFFHGDIQNLTVGRAHFTTLREFARHPFTPKSTIVTPKEHLFEELHKTLEKELEVDGAETQWFELLLLYRNKLAHLGTPMFPICVLHDHKGKLFSFLPNKWPVFHESNISFTNEPFEKKVGIGKYVEENHIHQDIVEYSEALLAKIYRLLDQSFVVLCRSYREFRDFELNESALKSLKNKKAKFDFKHFQQYGA